MAEALVKSCDICGKALPPKRRSFCSDKCSNRASQIRKYGITPEDYAKLTASGCCPICGRKVRRWNVDHNHKTGRVRGVTCGTCNQRVLTAIHSPLQAYALLEYLSMPPAYALEGDSRTVGSLIVKRARRRYFRG